MSVHLCAKIAAVATGGGGRGHKRREGGLLGLGILPLSQRLPSRGRPPLSAQQRIHGGRQRKRAWQGHHRPARVPFRALAQLGTSRWEWRAVMSVW
eukprot:CAMPEP_0114314006 /NCGR_PEP_ID=MMETSP0059-20121206/21509_1 /TAXON_ID=36894 /ORGANISM="Pyramimonas parkeae, Strain CCMP726" /LENGTH=95 /DNA_ID=CAMNT_0001438981 /DNA_START=959 /DNA_END=1243 /DNA_ORIENTATION=+